MKKIFIAVFCLSASMVWAQDGDENGTAEDDEVDLYIAVIENIDVTAEKPIVEVADDTETELDAILDEAEALEDDKVKE